MGLEQLKLELITWISTIEDIELLQQMEYLKDQNEIIPGEIINLLNQSSSDSNAKKHTSAKDFIV